MTDEEKLARADTFFAALRDQNIDQALAQTHEEVIVHSPMGKKKGHAKASGVLKMIAKLGGGNVEGLEMAGKDATAVGPSPMGKVRLTISFQDGLIKEIKTKMGG